MGVIDHARLLRKQIEKQAANMDDVEALTYSSLFPSWQPDGVSYATGDRMRFDNVLYKVQQDHVSQESWTPDKTPSLYAEVLIPDPDVISPWKQPDSTNPYMTGDKVTHNEKTWESACDYNVWEPGVYGWIEAVS